MSTPEDDESHLEENTNPEGKSDSIEKFDEIYEFSIN